MSQNSNNNTVHLNHGRFGLALVNSMIGAYLDQSQNPLAVQMGFYAQARKLRLDAPLPEQLTHAPAQRVIIFVHGLTQLENIWDYPPDDGSTASILSHYIDVCLDASPPAMQQDYGTKLQQELGFTPFYLRYNSGLSLDKNGRQLSQQIDALFAAYPRPIEELVLVGYGMGGRLLNYAQYAAQKSRSAWLPKLSRCVYLGNLHEGSLLAWLLQLSSSVIRSLPLYRSDAIADWVDVCSKRLQQTQSPSAETLAIFYAGAQHSFIRSDIRSASRPQAAAASVYADPAAPHCAPQNAPAGSRYVYLEGMSPLRLAHSDRVYALLAQWLSSGVKSEVAEPLASDSMAAYAVPLASHGVTPFGTIDARTLLMAGTLDLVAGAYDRAIEAVETMHYSIAETPFYAMEKLPLVSQLAKPFEAAQHEALDSLYRSLRHQGRLLHEYAAQMANAATAEPA